MPLLAYVAIILVSLGGILFEVNWLTSPKLETKPALQASATAVPPKVADAAVVPRSEAAPPRNVAPTVTLVPGASSAPAVAAAVSEATKPLAPQPAEPANQQAGTAPAISPAPFGAANAASTPSTNAASVSPSETTGAASPDFKREFTTDTKAVDTKSGSASAATFTPAATATPAPAVATSSNNKCDVVSCSAAYQSFRASDCTYQPIDGTARKVCDRAPDTAQRAAIPEPAQRALAPARDPRIEATSRKTSKDAELRAVEREVRRMTASEAALDPGYRRIDRSLDRNLLDRGRSEVIMIERPY